MASFTLFVFTKNDFEKLSKQISEIFNDNLEEKDESMIFTYSKEFEKQLNLLKIYLKDKNAKSIKKSAKIKVKNNQLRGILSSISHEFRNPISIIRISSQNLKSDDLPKELELKFLDKIDRNSQKLVNLIDRLNLKSTQGITLSRSEFDLKAVCIECKNELLEKYKNREILVQDRQALIKADETLIKQVIINLVENALKYSLNTVKISFEDGCLLVKDKGKGIKEEDIELVTKKYFKTEDNIATNSFGIGLYVVKHILKLHDFEMIIQSEFGVGSTFGFRYKT